jgi:hypothetical protein
LTTYLLVLLSGVNRMVDRSRLTKLLDRERREFQARNPRPAAAAAGKPAG